MTMPYTRAPHSEGSNKGTTHTHTAPNAALLIDFDNVTMGMRSDLSKELKNLLNSDIIRGKVAVQRAYADWRRYPQYIVPLSEASIDLIFAPAYGSSKKNATDIRMAIDALELIFIRPEIGTFILLTGDSDFSSLVLKLKEYGKYVIGVGIQESSSDILVQNCDEYYSYTSLAGLRKTTEADTEPVDPWLLVERALERMERRNDVMRSDRLKQVMMEIDAGFDESEYGFSKFSKFLTEASSRGLVELRRLDNGQYEVHPGGGGKGAREKPREKRESRSEGRRGRSTRARSKDRESERSAGRKERSRPERAVAEEAPSTDEDPLKTAYDLLTRSLKALLADQDEPAVRDSDVKRRMLELDSSFDEAELGFSKFSRFLAQADEHGVVQVRRRESGNYEVALPGTPLAAEPSEEAPEEDAEARRAREKEAEPAVSPPAPTPGAPGGDRPGRTLGPRRGERHGGRGTRRDGAEGPPPLLEGQVVSSAKSSGAAPSSTGTRAPGPDGGGPTQGPTELGLPTDRNAVIRYLANSYKGVGEKTAEALVDTLGNDLFRVLQTDPDRVREVIPSNRADQLLDAWEDDLRRRRARLKDASGEGRGDGGGDGGGDGPTGGGSGPGGDGRDDDASGDDESEPERSRLGRRGRRTRR